MSVLNAADAARGRNPAPAALARLRAWLADHSDAAVLAIVLTVGFGLRIALASAAPVLVLGDSETYLAPAVALEQGGGFDLPLKRTPGYPLLLAAVLRVFGEDLGSVALVQHALGLATSVLTYFVARRLAGAGAGLVAGLATALAGNLLVYERLVMTEALFTTTLLAAVAALVFAVERGSLRWLPAVGLVIAAATLVRPVGQALLLLPPIALLLAGRGWRALLVGSLLAWLGYGAAIGAWTLRTAGTPDGSSVGALGQTLVGRTARHDRRDPAADTGFVYFDPQRDAADPDPVRLAARQILQDAANRGTSGRAVSTRLGRELGLSERAADRLMRELAIEAIARRPGYYVSGTVQRFARLWNTPVERLRGTWSEQATVRRAWEDAPSAALLDRRSGQPERPAPFGELLTGAFQPSYLGWAFAGLFVLGLAAAVAANGPRLALVPACGALGLMALSVALVGGVSRYRYPEDPLIFVVIGVGLAQAVAAVRRLSARRRTGTAWNRVPA